MGEVEMKKSLMMVVPFLVLLSVSCNLIGGTGSARLSGMTAGLSPRMDEFRSWLTIEFRKYPKKGDLRDVKVVFSSVALSKDAVFDWNFIASKDCISKGFGKGFIDNAETLPDKDPPLKVPVRAVYTLPVLQKIELNPGQVISLKAELYWAGVKQDEMSKTIEHVYRRGAE
jgi:hypothetical protein